MVATGRLADRIGRRPVMLGATALAFVGAWPLFWLMHHPDPALVLLGQLGFVLSVGTFVGCQPAVMVEAVPWQVRCTAIRARLQRHAGCHRWPQSAGRDVAGGTHTQRLQPGLHDHGGRGDFLPRHPELQGNLSDAAREGLVNQA